MNSNQGRMTHCWIITIPFIAVVLKIVLTMRSLLPTPGPWSLPTGSWGSWRTAACRWSPWGRSPPAPWWCGAPWWTLTPSHSSQDVYASVLQRAYTVQQGAYTYCLVLRHTSTPRTDLSDSLGVAGVETLLKRWTGDERADTTRCCCKPATGTRGTLSLYSLHYSSPDPYSLKPSEAAPSWTILIQGVKIVI